jgi:trehalose-phosphatase
MSAPASFPDVLAGIPERLWTRLASTDHRLLLLDYDGTIAPIRVHYEEAPPLPGIVPLLEGLVSSERTSVIVISGRPIADLERLLGPLPVTLVGEHGWETRRPDGLVFREPLPVDAGAALERAIAAATGAGLGARLERKRCSVVLHTRDLAAPQARETESACGRLWEIEEGHGGLRLDRTGGGLELRAAGRTKGSATRDRIAASWPGSLVVYLGDEASDEEAFAVVEPEGLAIRVGPAERPSRATSRLPSVDAVAVFLSTWLRVAREADGARTRGA